jgi:tRNA (guanine37-N1)-methyltransferase
VPKVLLSGDHAGIRRWRLAQAVARTVQRRPDLLVDAALAPEAQRLVDEYRSGRHEAAAGPAQAAASTDRGERT